MRVKVPIRLRGYYFLLLAEPGGRAVDLGGGGARVYQGGPKFEIKHKNRCLQQSKLVDWGGQACR